MDASDFSFYKTSADFRGFVAMKKLDFFNIICTMTAFANLFMGLS